MLECDCGKTVEDWRGARGHVQFTDDQPDHGDQNDVPDGWKDLFSEDEDDVDEQDVEADDDGTDDDPTEADTTDAPDEDDDGTATDSGRSTSDRLKTALTDDVRALWGGDR